MAASSEGPLVSKLFLFPSPTPVSATTTSNANRLTFQETPTQVELGWFSWLHFLSNVIILIIQTSLENAERRKARPSPIWSSFNHPNFASLQIPKCSTSFCCYKIRQCSLLNWSNAGIKITVNGSKITPLLSEMARMLFNITCSPIWLRRSTLGSGDMNHAARI